MKSIDLSKVFFDTSMGYISKHKLKKKLLKEGYSINNKELDEFYSNNETVQRNKKIRVKGNYKITGTPKDYQIDVIKFPIEFKKSNRGYHKFLGMINIISRKAYLYPIKSNKTEDIMKAYMSFFNDVKGNIYRIESDDEFKNNEFQRFNREHDIVVMAETSKDDHLTSYGNRLGIIDRFVRTLKDRIRNYCESQGTKRFINVLDKIIDNYNDTPHRSLPNEASPNETHEDGILQTKVQDDNYKHNKKIKKSIDFNIGDSVRIAEYKGIFEKEKATFSKDIHTIEDIVGNRFKIEGLKRLYKHYELMKVDPSKIIRLKDDTRKYDKKVKEDRLQEKIKRILKRDGIDITKIRRITRHSRR